MEISGPGEIWQDAEGVLQFKIFAGDGGWKVRADEAAHPKPIGELFREDDYFRLTTENPSGAPWQSERVLPRAGLFDGIARGKLSELSRVAQCPLTKSALARLYFRGKQEFPCNEGTRTVVQVGGQDRSIEDALNVAIFDEGTLAFEAAHEGEHTVLTLRLLPTDYHNATPSRVYEALQFVMGKQLAWMALETTIGGEQLTRLISWTRPRASMLPPLTIDKVDPGGHFWRMFRDYFRYVHSDKGEQWHPVSRHVGSAIEAHGASMDASLLTLAVAVEGIAVDCFSGLAPVSQETLREFDLVLSSVATLGLSEQVASRVSGSLRAMKQARGSDVVRAFIKEHALPEGLYKAWSLARNITTHGSARSLPVEKMIGLGLETLSLFYALVLAAIGYRGSRTDYNAQDWPNTSWPVSERPSLGSELH
ncbi:MAG: hypothetical protein ABI672_11780 [Vicinamibacteria bacterium]